MEEGDEGVDGRSKGVESVNLDRKINQGCEQKGHQSGDEKARIKVKLGQCRKGRLKMDYRGERRKAKSVNTSARPTIPIPRADGRKQFRKVLKVG